MLLLIILFLTGCSLERKAYIGRVIDVNIDSCNIEFQRDTHGGFLGDGDYFGKLKCSNNLDLSSNWKLLPLSSSIQEVLEMSMCNQSDCLNFFERNHVSEITNGYYYFYDRHSESINPYSDIDLNNRSSYNFSLAIYDIDNNIIYFYEFDT